MRVIYDVSSFPFLENLRSSNRLMTFEEILNNTADEDEDYQQIRNEGLRSTFDRLKLGLVIVGQPLSIFVDWTMVSKLEVEQSNAIMNIDQVTKVFAPEISAMPTSGLPTEKVQANPPTGEGDIKIGGVRETLDEILAELLQSRTIEDLWKRLVLFLILIGLVQNIDECFVCFAPLWFIPRVNINHE